MSEPRLRRRHLLTAQLAVLDAEDVFAEVKAKAAERAEAAAVKAMPKGFREARRAYGRTMVKARESAAWQDALAACREARDKVREIRPAVAGPGDVTVDVPTAEAKVVANG